MGFFYWYYFADCILTNCFLTLVHIFMWLYLLTKNNDGATSLHVWKKNMCRWKMHVVVNQICIVPSGNKYQETWESGSSLVWWHGYIYHLRDYLGFSMLKLCPKEPRLPLWLPPCIMLSTVHFLCHDALWSSHNTALK